MFDRMKVGLRRLLALLFDSLVIQAAAALFFPLNRLTSAGVKFPLLLGAAAALPYAALAFMIFFVFDFFSLSPGKKLLGLKIVNAEGGRITFWQAALRAFLVILCSGVWVGAHLWWSLRVDGLDEIFRGLLSALLFGSLAMVFSPSAQTVIDFLSKSLVLKPPAAPVTSKSPAIFFAVLFVGFLIFNLSVVNSYEVTLRNLVAEKFPPGSEVSARKRFGARAIDLKFLIEPSAFGPVATAAEAKQNIETLFKAVNDFTVEILAQLPPGETEDGASVQFLQPAAIGLLVYTTELANQKFSAEKIEELRVFNSAHKAWSEADELVKKNLCAEAYAKYESAIKQTEESQPRSPHSKSLSRNIRNNYAWSLLSCPDQSRRDPRKSLEVVQPLMNENPEVLSAAEASTIACAYGEAGDYKSMSRVAAKAGLESTRVAAMNRKRCPDLKD
jgi:uncharacterized RDD family membrane protein YckC